MPLPSANVIVNSRSTLMPSDSAIRRLSTAARICAPISVRSKREPQQQRDQRADHDQQQAVGAIRGDADVDLALQRLRQDELLVLRPDQQHHERAQREHEADGEQHLVELGRPIEAPVEQPLDRDR